MYLWREEHTADALVVIQIIWNHIAILPTFTCTCHHHHDGRARLIPQLAHMVKVALLPSTRKPILSLSPA
jgi:hypothetical protein